MSCSPPLEARGVYVCAVDGGRGGRRYSRGFARLVILPILSFYGHHHSRRTFPSEHQYVGNILAGLVLMYY